MIISATYKRTVSKEALKQSPTQPSWVPAFFRRKDPSSDTGYSIRPIPVTA